MNPDVQRAVAARESAFARVRLATGIAVAAGLALTGAFSALAAKSTHLRKKAPSSRAVQRSSVRRPAKPVVAPAPPLVSAGGGAPAPAPSPSSSPAPAPTPVAPVVVSGGS